MMLRKGPDQRTNAATHGAERGLNRFEGFSDAVFAIALTLLIVEIKVPGSPEGAHGYGDLVSAMAEQWREYLALVLCYLVIRSEEHTSELQSQFHLVCRLLLEKKKKN